MRTPENDSELARVAEMFVARRIGPDQTALVNHLLALRGIDKSAGPLITEFHLESIRNYDALANEQGNAHIFWFPVEDPTADDLEKVGAALLRNEYGSWWGWLGTGAPASEDRAIRAVAASLHWID